MKNIHILLLILILFLCVFLQNVINLTPKKVSHESFENAKNSARIFVINMDRSVDRINYINKHFSDLNIKFEKFKAFDGYKDNLTEFENNFLKKGNWKHTKGITGAAISHYRLWKKIVNENIERAVIFEDDIIIKGNIYNLLQKIPNKVEFAFLGNNVRCDPMYKLESQNKYDIEVDDIKFKIDNKHDGMWAYYVTKSGCNKLLQKIDKYGMFEAIDWFVLNKNHKDDKHFFNIYNIYPCLAIHHGGFESGTCNSNC